MSIATWGRDAAPPIPTPARRELRMRRLRRGLLLTALLAGAGWAAQAGGAAETADAVARAGGDLTRLMRFMAVLKATMAAGAAAAVWWRLAVPAGAGWLLPYLAAAAAAAAGPVLIWGMAHVGLGALLLHGGLLAALALLWRDPAVAARLGCAGTPTEPSSTPRESQAGSAPWWPRGAAPSPPADPHRGGGAGKASTSPV